MQRGQECCEDHWGSGALQQDAECAGDDQEGHYCSCLIVHVAWSGFNVKITYSLEDYCHNLFV